MTLEQRIDKQEEDLKSLKKQLEDIELSFGCFKTQVQFNFDQLSGTNAKDLQSP